MGDLIGMMQRHRLLNIRKNIKTVEHRVYYPQGLTDITVSLICYGPSLLVTWPEIDPKSKIVSVSGARDFLIGKGIRPDSHVEFDPRPHKARHISDDNNLYLFASCVNPATVKAAGNAMVMLWHAQQSEQETALILRGEPDAKLIPGGSSVGLRAIELLYALGHRRFEIYGMDSSFSSDGETQWAGPHYGTSRYKRDLVKIQGYVTSMAFAIYAHQFLKCVERLSDAEFNLHGDGLTQKLYRHYQKEKAA